MRDQAIYKMYPKAVEIREGEHAFDKDGNELAVDEARISPELDKLEKEHEKAESDRKDKEKQREKDEVDIKSTPTTLEEVIEDIERMKRIMGVK